MKFYHILWTAISITLISSLISCNNQKQEATKEENIDIHTAKSSLDWEGSYYGVLPCADCAGIQTQLNINDDSYEMLQKFNGKDGMIKSYTGSFDWNESGDVITIHADELNDMHFKVREGSLLVLDSDAKEITDELKDEYVMEKRYPTFENTSWSASQIGDLDISNNAPYIRFGADDKISGNSGCNQIMGRYMIGKDMSLSFDRVAMTRMACEDMDTESAFGTAINKVASYEIIEDEMDLKDGKGNVLMTMKPVYIE